MSAVDLLFSGHILNQTQDDSRKFCSDKPALNVKFQTLLHERDDLDKEFPLEDMNLILKHIGDLWKFDDTNIWLV